jgi:hypothetical protein
MRTTIWSALIGLTLLVPAGLMAQDDRTDGGKDGERDRRNGRCSCGLREVSDRRSASNRTGLWLSAGIGGGAEAFDARDGLGWSDDRGGAIGYIKVGGTVSPSLRVGAEFNAWTSRYQSQGYDRSLSSVMLIAQWYPAARGDFWLRGGVGLARAEIEPFPNAGQPSFRSDGLATAIGLGYDFRLARNVALVPTIDLAGYRYDDIDDRVLSFGLGITIH